eukprot:CAMPEP_0174951428 /NCGR_PEP_ID=MMETSP1355-20121228/94845_1 /TAXON_ID=464990 /ORGANISM="Hemiselmis tepida, Strain CCMP443" /LENGTH=68 /DNA_ID=CAMNT_0016199083 /DNA_START=655 /DNA_END=857 /DNA_ORIENTATION=-
MEEGTEPPPNPFGSPAARFKPSAGFDSGLNVEMEEDDEEGGWSDDEHKASEPSAESPVESLPGEADGG